MNESCLFVLGADDPEMCAIERVIRASGHGYHYAKIGDRRVGPGEAYSLDVLGFAADVKTVFVECAPKSPAGLPDDVLFIDHHRPGDPGYSLGASEYWKASSLGQLCELLLVPPSDELRVIAAVDHCFASAIRGKCHGVLGAVAREVYVKSVASVHGHAYTTLDIYDLILACIIKIPGSPKVRYASQDVFDCSDWDVGSGYTAHYLSAIAAAAISDRVILLRQGSEKLVLCGAAMPSTVAAFKARAGDDFGLENIYGVPVRGYAGGYYRN